LKKVKIKFLGSGDAFGSGGRFQTCIFIESDDTGLLLDCGASALISMKHFGVSLLDIDCIFITHLHGDHFGGIPFFILDSQLISRRTEPLLIVGPPGLEERIINAMEINFPGSSQVRQKYKILFEFNPAGRHKSDSFWRRPRKWRPVLCPAPGGVRKNHCVLGRH
jgi:ribonuclease BN (tRNA processing enzyme)